jgi:hypothetical protein
MSKSNRVEYAIELVRRADDTLGSALRVLSGLNPLAAEHIVESQGQCLDAITHLETGLKRKSKKNLTSARECVKVGA